MTKSSATVHLLRTAAGIESLAHLHETLNTNRLMLLPSTGRMAVAIHTRRKPQRADELLNGGSLYWIVKHMIKARQEILDIEVLQDEDGRDFCRIYLDTQIMLTCGIPHRAIQGWRYLPKERAPEDIGVFDADIAETEEIAEELAKDLKEIAFL